MDDTRRYPVALGNVTYLQGAPEQEHLASIASRMVSETDLAAAITVFSDSLLRAGRPGKRSNVTVEYGPRITDWIMSGAFLKRAPWHDMHWCRTQKLPMFELHAYGRSGWCAEVCDGVLLHVPFSGNDDGLTSLEMACVLSESPNPDQALVDWLQSHLDDELHFDIQDVANYIPEPLRQHLGYHFQYQQRIVSMWPGGNADAALCARSYSTPLLPLCTAGGRWHA